VSTIGTLITDTIMSTNISKISSYKFSTGTNLTNEPIPVLSSLGNLNSSSFYSQMTVTVSAGTLMRSQYLIEGVLGANDWELYSSYLGDNLDVTFQITSGGTVLCTSTVGSLSSMTFAYITTLINV
jgi:hypothetical protein